MQVSVGKTGDGGLGRVWSWPVRRSCRACVGKQTLDVTIASRDQDRLAWSERPDLAGEVGMPAAPGPDPAKEGQCEALARAEIGTSPASKCQPPPDDPPDAHRHWCFDDHDGIGPIEPLGKARRGRVIAVQHPGVAGDHGPLSLRERIRTDRGPVCVPVEGVEVDDGDIESVPQAASDGRLARARATQHHHASHLRLHSPDSR